MRRFLGRTVRTSAVLAVVLLYFVPDVSVPAHAAPVAHTTAAVTDVAPFAATGTDEPDDPDSGGSVAATLTDQAVPLADQTASPSLVSSWPRDGVVLWVPPKEGRLSFTTPVRSSSLELLLERTDDVAFDGSDVARLTTGESVTEILFRLPPITPGPYRLEWSVTAESGEQLGGVVTFSLDAPLAAVGGQNHRHGGSVLYQDSPVDFLLRMLFVLSAALLLAAVVSGRTRREGAQTDTAVRVLVRVGAGVLGLAALATAVVDAVRWTDTYHDKPLAAFVAAPGTVLLFPLLAFAALLVMRPRAGSTTAAGAMVVLASHSGVSYAARAENPAPLLLVLTVLLCCLALFWALLLVAVPDVLARRVPEVRRQLTRLLGIGALLLASSVALLVLHANGFVLRMAFAADLQRRLSLGALLLPLIVLLGFLAGRRRVLRLLGVLVVAALFVVSALLGWVPPPAAGL